MRVLLVADCGFYHVGAFFRTALARLGIPHAVVDEGRHVGRLAGGRLLRGLFRVSGARRLACMTFNAAVLREGVRFRPDVVLIVK